MSPFVMERGLPMAGASYLLPKSTDREGSTSENLPLECRFSWYWNIKEIEIHSPSRKDGIDWRKETQLRMTYCSFLQYIGRRLEVPQVTIATAIILCHRFYLHQSHAKNEWQTIATVCVFLASKIEDTPVSLEKVAIVAYQAMYERNPPAAQRIINDKAVLGRQKELIVIGERLLLCTIRFDFDIQHPYKPLHLAFKELGFTQEDTHKEMRQTAWNFVNEWLRTTLCLQYTPNYIAAGTLYLAAKHHNVKLPSGSGGVWWEVFGVKPSILDAVVRQMRELLGHQRRPGTIPEKPKLKPVQPPAVPSTAESSSSPDSCVLSEDGPSPGHVEQDASTTRQRPSVADRCEPVPEDPNGLVDNVEEVRQGTGNARKEPNIDVERIKALMKMRKRKREGDKCVKAAADVAGDDWIERELEAGLELSTASSSKRQR